MHADKNIPVSDVIVIGAGASGLTAAIAAARKGASVLILEHNSISAKKILSTGNGKCNFTNARQEPSCYRSDRPQLVQDAMEQFSWKDTVVFFEELGILTKSVNGYYYPRSAQASAVRDALLSGIRELGVHVRFKTELTGIQFKTDGFHIQTNNGAYRAGRCILATGGIAAPKTGSDGSGYLYAKQLGHTVVRPLPALVALSSPAPWIPGTAGVRCDARVSLFVDGEKQAEDTGELQLADYGISGIPTFQVSRYASVSLAEKHRTEAEIDFIPEMPAEELYPYLSARVFRSGAKKTWRDILNGVCNQKIADMICRTLRLQDSLIRNFPEQTVKEQLALIVRQLKATRIPISGTGAPERAQTTCGGVPLKEIGVDMQSGFVPGLYFAGEILNVDGICGGYNLQWAWTSGFIAGSHAAD
ncbi:MAG: NAD(P)/FAD-dependent oxidoreductase [Clostridiales bacterium]|nr:NAD(P)/FAD-dependent oxidoreductase [Clostridiales bacterium]